MKETVKILWSGFGRTGSEALRQVEEMQGAEIVAGLSRRPLSDGNIIIDGITQNMDGTSTLKTRFTDLPKWYQYSALSTIDGKKPNKGDFDVIVDFSHPDVLEKVVELAVHMNVPLISGTSGLSDRQMAMLYDATNRIPVFRGGNFRFKVKMFVDEVVKLARMHSGLILTEEFYAGKHLPSETSRVIRRRVREATGKHMEVFSSAPYPPDSGINEWSFDADSSANSVPLAQCRAVGYQELAQDVLRIAKVMAKKPVKKGDFYDLDEIWDELVSWALC